MYRKNFTYFPSDILSITFFRLLLTIKRYYNNRWSFWPGGDASPPLSYAESPRAFWAAILIRSSLAVGGEGILPKFYAGRFLPEVQSLTLLYTIFERKGPLSFTVYWRMLPLSPKKFEPLLSAVNALSLKHELITKLESFMDFFTSIKRICRPFRAFLQTEMTDFPTLLSIASTSDSLPYHIPEAWKRYPFRAESNLLLV